MYGTQPTLHQERLALPEKALLHHTDSCQASPRRPYEEIEYVGSRPVVKRQKIRQPKDAACGTMDLMDGPPPDRQRWVPAPASSRPYCPNPDLLRGERVSTGMVRKLPPMSTVFDYRGGCSFPELYDFSLNQPDHKSRLPSLSPISPKQNCKTASPSALRKGATAFETISSAPAQAILPADSVSLVVSGQVPAAVQPRAPPIEDKPTTPTPSYPGRTLPQGEKLDITPSPPVSTEARAMVQTGLAQSHAACCCCCAPTKHNVAYPRASGLPAMAPPPPHPNNQPPIYAPPQAHVLPPHLSRAPFLPMVPPSMPHGYSQGFPPMMTPMPLGTFNGYQTPPLAMSPGHPAIRLKPAGFPETPKPAAAALVSKGTQTQHVRPGQESPFRSHPGLIQPTYRKTSPNLVVDVAETCQEKFPFEEVAARHHTSVDKVVDVFAAIIQVPLLRCPTDRRRAGKLATARMKEVAQAKKSMIDNAGNANIDTDSVAVAEHMGPLELPDGSACP